MALYLGNNKVAGNLVNNEVVLYDNPSGSNGNITLSDSVANYEYIEIYYRTNDNYVGSQKLYKPNGKTTWLFGVQCGKGSGSTSGYAYLKCKKVTISEKSINNITDGYSEIGIGSISTNSNANYIYITRVVGYK